MSADIVVPSSWMPLINQHGDLISRCFYLSLLKSRLQGLVALVCHQSQNDAYPTSVHSSFAKDLEKDVSDLKKTKLQQQGALSHLDGRSDSLSLSHTASPYLLFSWE